MRNFKILKTGIQTVFVLVVIWTIFFITVSAFNKLENNNLEFIPINSEVVIRIDATQLLKESVKGLLETEDNDFIQLIKDLRRDASVSASKPNGIALNSDIALISIPDGDEMLFGAVLNITNQQDFRDYFTEIEHTGIASNNEVGLILFLPESNSDTNTKAEELFLGKHAEIDFESSSDGITVWTKTNAKNYNRLDIQIEQERIHFSGNITNTFSPKVKMQTLIPEGFHVTILDIPNRLNDSIHEKFGDTIPNITGMSMNYFGTELIEEPEFLVAPEGDFIVQFETAINLKTYIDHFHETMFVDSVIGNICYYGPKPYYSKQISENVIYFGIHDFNSEKLSKQAPIVLLTGDLSKMTQIEGGGFFKRILEIIPSYGASKQLAGKIRTFNISLNETDKDAMNVDGDIIFNEDKYASIEFIRFLLIGQFF